MKYSESGIAVVAGTGGAGLIKAGFEVIDELQPETIEYTVNNLPYSCKAKVNIVQLGGNKGPKIDFLDRHYTDNKKHRDGHKPAYLIDHGVNMKLLTRRKNKIVISTSACGGCHPDIWKVGDLVLVRNGVDQSYDNKYWDGMLPYTSGDELFNHELTDMIAESAERLGIDYQDSGIYYVNNSTKRGIFESDHEIQRIIMEVKRTNHDILDNPEIYNKYEGKKFAGKFQFVGGLVGMNAVPEAQWFRKHNSRAGQSMKTRKYACISIITDHAQGTSKIPPDHNVHVDEASKAMYPIGKILADTISRILEKQK